MIPKIGYFAPDLRPGWTFLNGQQESPELIAARTEHAKCEDEVQNLANTFDDSSDPIVRANIVYARAEAIMRMNAAWMEVVRLSASQPR